MNKHGEDMDKYMEVISDPSFDPITKLEEREMLASTELSDREKRDILVKRNTRLVCNIAKKYTNIAELDDMIQEGIVGLNRAVESFDTTKNIKFCTYAYWHIVKSIQEYLTRENRSFSSIRNQSVLSFNHHSNSSDDEYTETYRLENEVNESTYSDTPSGYKDIRKNELNMLTDKISELVDTDILNEREKLIVHKRFLINKPMTLMEIGKMIGISHSMVKIIGDKAVGKLREHIENEGYSKKDFLEVI